MYVDRLPTFTEPLDNNRSGDLRSTNKRGVFELVRDKVVLPAGELLLLFPMVVLFFGLHALTSSSPHLIGKMMMKQRQRKSMCAWCTGLVNEQLSSNQITICMFYDFVVFYRN